MTGNASLSFYYSAARLVCQLPLADFSAVSRRLRSRAGQVFRRSAAIRALTAFDTFGRMATAGGDKLPQRSQRYVRCEEALHITVWRLCPSSDQEGTQLLRVPPERRGLRMYITLDQLLAYSAVIISVIALVIKCTKTK